MARDAAPTSRHVFIYGPPAAGKLTVARALSDTYGLRVLDNHLSFDVALRLFDFGTKPFSDLVQTLRVTLFGAAASAGVDVVSTFVFAHPSDRPHVAHIVKAAATSGAAVDFVQLLPARDVLEERVTASSRATTEKIRDLGQLRRLLDRFDLKTRINDSDLSIDNGALAPEQAARQIAAHLGLLAGQRQGRHEPARSE